MTFKFTPASADQDSYVIVYPWKSKDLDANTEFSIGDNDNCGYLGSGWGLKITSTDATWGNVGASADGSIDAFYVGKNAIPVPRDGKVTRFASCFRYYSYSDDVKVYLLHCSGSSVSNNHDGDCTFSVVATLSFDVDATNKTTHFYYAGADCTTNVLAGDLLQIALQNIDDEGTNNVYLVGSSTIGIEATSG